MPPQANAAAARNAKAKSTAEELEAAEARREAEKEEPRIEDIIHRIDYSDKYSDDHYEYRHVTLPRELAKYIPKDYWDPATRALRLLADEEWRGIGITQSMGWEHYAIHVPEPLILLFRRSLTYVPPTEAEMRAAMSRRKN